MELLVSGMQTKTSYNNTDCIGFYFVPNHRHSEALFHFQLCENVTKKTVLNVLRADCLSLLPSFGFR